MTAIGCCGDKRYDNVAASRFEILRGGNAPPPGSPWQREECFAPSPARGKVGVVALSLRTSPTKFDFNSTDHFFSTGAQP